MNDKLIAAAVDISDGYSHKVIKVIVYLKSKRILINILDKQTEEYTILPLRHFQWLCRSLESGRKSGSLKTNRRYIFYENGNHCIIRQRSAGHRAELHLSLQEVNNMTRWKYTVYEICRIMSSKAGEVEQQRNQVIGFEQSVSSTTYNPESIEIEDDTTMFNIN